MDDISKLYIMANIMTFVSYLPQILNLARDTTRSESLALASWALWISSSTISVAYFSVNVKDPLAIMTSSFTFLGNAAILGLLVYNRYIKREGTCVAALVRSGRTRR